MPLSRIAPRDNLQCKHSDGVILLCRLIIELKIARARKDGEDWARAREPEDLATDVWIADLEKLVDDIEGCKEPIVHYHHAR